MPNYTVSQDIDDFMKSDDDSAARTELGLGSAATSNTGDFATSIQGGKADTALQSGDNVSTLTNDAGYLTTAPAAPVDSVNTQTGAVVLDADDISDSATTNKFATQIELDKANSALQSGDNVSSLTNDAGYLTTAAAAPVDSVNTQVGAVVLDADDIDDSVTTNKFATAAQLSNADSALQSGDNISELTNNSGYITSAPVDSVNTQTGAVVLDADDISDATTTNKFATQAELDKANSSLQSLVAGTNITIDATNPTSPTINSSGGGAVDSVNTQTGVVVLDADDISDATTTNKFATQAQLDNADNALQSGDNVSALTNDAGYLTTAPAAPVDSVNNETGAVVLDADDIDDTATTNKFATQAQLDKADTALQPADPTLESVTTNGATTTNDISVGRIVTLHPSNPVNDNIASGNQACAIGGVANLVSGNRSVNYGGRDNQVTGNDSTTIGGFGQIVIGQEAEGFGSTATTLNTKYTSAIGAINSVVGLATAGTASTATAHSSVLGGNTNIIESATEAVIIGGDTNTIQSTHHRSVILGGTGIVTDAADTTYVPNLNVGAGFKMPTGATDAYVLTSDANGVGTWQAAGGGGGGSSIVASYVDNALVVNKPATSNIVLSITGLQYQMEIGKTYYVKMFFNHEGGQMSGGSSNEFIILDHTPWSTTANVERGFAGTNWVESTGGGGGSVFGGKASNEDTLYHVGASTGLSNFFGFQPYKGFVSIEGFITAPSTANFTPTLTYTGGGTGSITGSFQGMIMEMP